ncbi:MAG TPA: BMP family ABC transporter substrate-binding protein, partial [Anaerolineales bacterium]|nr:BMP family ABC transporter substrate-binding protein [Anaerolineales bacterium]
MRKGLTLLAFLTILAVLLTACGPKETPTEEVFKVGMVTDVGGIDDKSFNATSWQGMEMAAEELGVEVAYLESQQQTDYAVNISQFIDQGYDMI